MTRTRGSDPAPNRLLTRRRLLAAGGVGAGLLAGSALLPDLATAEPAGRTPRRVSPAVRLLQRPPFAPGDVGLFTPQAYPAAPPTVPAAPYRVSEQRALAELRTLLARHGSDVRAGCRIFDSAALRAVAPDPRMRAAFASLSGTPAEGSIRAITGGGFSRAEIGPIPAGVNPLTAAVTITPAGATRSVVILNEKYAYEPVGLIAVIMVHEPLHHDTRLTNKEELIISSLDTAMHARFVADGSVDPARGTELTRKWNTKLMALVNTRDADGHVRVRTSQGNVYPGGATPLAAFAEAYPGYADAVPTPGNPYLDSILRSLLRLPGTGHAFDDTTLGLLDTHIDNALTPEGWVTVARRLRLKLA